MSHSDAHKTAIALGLTDKPKSRAHREAIAAGLALRKALVAAALSGDYDEVARLAGVMNAKLEKKS